MDSVSRSSKGFPDDEEEDEDEYGRREGSSQRVDLSIKVDGKGNDQKQPTTPRSKHSATEQRRRSKINDRFQILRDLIPHSDQKRDKASFLLEVIEYIRFLHEKVQKYESYPGWNQENMKLTPWSNAQGHGDGIADPHLVLKNGPAAPGFMYSGKFDDNTISITPTQNPPEPEVNLQPNLYASVGREANFTQPQPRLVSDSDNIASQSQSQWLRSSFPADCTVSSEMVNEQEELTIDEGTIAVSNVYSQGLMTSLTQALESSGIDMSQASVSVQISLAKRAISKRPAPTTTSSAKDDEPSSGNRAMGHSMVGSSGEESEQPSKRHKCDDTLAL